MLATAHHALVSVAKTEASFDVAVLVTSCADDGAQQGHLTKVRASTRPKVVVDAAAGRVIGTEVDSQPVKYLAHGRQPTIGTVRQGAGFGGAAGLVAGETWLAVVVGAG